MSNLAKVLTSVFVLCAVLSGAAQASVYTSSAYGFSMQEPEGWEKTEFPGRDDGVVLLYHGPKEALLMVRMVKDTVNLENDTERDEVLSGFLDSLREGGMQLIEVLDEGFATIGDAKGYGMHYSYYLPSGVRVENASTFIAGSDRYFIVTYAEIPSVYQQFVDKIWDVVKSFRILPREEEMYLEPGGKSI